ncbi:MAG: restriction endonuclease subunit S [Acidobacteria bacterium]|nr:restriction endonuclease subunit S [Acidobacteriota bacterium]
MSGRPAEQIVANSPLEGLELPEGWAGARVTDLCNLVRGVSYKKGEASTEPRSGLVAILRANNIGEGRLNFDDLQYVPAERVAHHQKLKLGDVIVAMSSGSKKVVGKAASLDAPWDGGFGAFCGVLRPVKHIDRRYFGYWFQTRVYRDTISDTAAGVNINNIKREHFDSLKIPLPPLVEQERIVAQVEALRARVNAARERLAKLPAILKRFRQSVLAAACSGQLTADWRQVHPDIEPATSFLKKLNFKRRALWEERERAKLIKKGKLPANDCWKKRYPEPFEPKPDYELPETWVAATTSHLALLDVGHAFQSKEFADNGIRLLRGENVEPGSLRWLDTKHWPESKLVGFEHLLVQQGEIILAMDRPVISAGLKIARTTANDVPCLLVQRITRFKMVEPVLTAYLYFCLQNGDFIRHLSHGLTGSDLPHITGTGVAEYTFGFPPFPEQQEIVRRAEALFALAERIEHRVQAATEQVESTRQSILARAFRGELVETEADLARREGRDYESAAQLLGRILAERAIEPAGRRWAPPKKARKPKKAEMS